MTNVPLVWLEEKDSFTQYLLCDAGDLLGNLNQSGDRLLKLKLLYFHKKGPVQINNCFRR